MMDSRNGIPGRGRAAFFSERRAARRTLAENGNGSALRGVNRTAGEWEDTPEDGMMHILGDEAIAPILENGGRVNGSCGGDTVLAGYPLAMVYAPDQTWENVYDDDAALQNGTLFAGLYLPFCPGCRR